MKISNKFLIILTFLGMNGCVIAPYGYGYHHRYYGPHAVAAPAAVVIVPAVAVRAD